MASTAALHGPPPPPPASYPPAPPGPNPESQPSYNSRVPNPGQHDPRLQGPQDLGPHVSARPFMCVPVPPPPPFLHYQWPMPFSYNPFTGFPGMGYGMVMPPFPPPLPYMEAPAYVMPHPQFQPMDYRRLLHPSVPAPSAPHQHPNQPRRARPPHTAPVRETTNSEVQTEPPQRGPGAPGEGPLSSLDSGHGTMSNSPSSSSRSSSRSSSSSHRPDSTRVQARAGTSSKDSQVKRSSSGTTVSQGLNLLQSSGSSALQSSSRKQPQRQRLQELLPAPCRDGLCSMWSVDSPEELLLVCSSSQQEDEDLKERRVSVPDILRSWAAASPQEVMLQSSELPQKETQLLPHQAEAEKEEEQTPAEEAPVADGAAEDEAQGDVGVTEADALFKILKLPLSLEELLSESIRENQPSASMEEVSREELLDSFQQPQKLLHNQTNPQAETSEVTAYQSFVDSFHMKRRMNESIWSVESLAPFVPSKESLQQSGVFEPKVLAESTEQEENHGAVRLNSALKASTERRRSLRFSSSDSLLLSDNMIVFSTPALQQSGSQEQRMESEVCERRESVKEQSSTPSEKASSAPPPRLQRRIILSPPTREEADEDRSSEPEAPQSPNQESLTPPEQEEKSSSEQEEKSSSEQEQTLLMSTAEKEEKPSPPSRLILKDGEDGKSEDGAGESAEVRESQLSVPAAQQTTAVSPSRGNLVDSGVQCGLMEEHQCVCEKSSYGPNKRQQLRYQDLRYSDCRDEGGCTSAHNPKNQKRNTHWKNRGPEKQNGQTDGYNGFSGKPGRQRGGNGRNHRY